MTTTALPERTHVAGNVTLHDLGLSIEATLSFNEWRNLVLQLLHTTDRALWSLGDAWLYGERYAKDHHQAIRELEAMSRFPMIGARVARGFPQERRRGQLSFEVHAILAGAEEAEQERWLDEAERLGWGRDQMQFEFAETIERVPVAAISARVTGTLHELLLREAERRDMEPTAVHDIALERGLREMAGEELEAA